MSKYEVFIVEIDPVCSYHSISISFCLSVAYFQAKISCSCRVYVFQSSPSLNTEELDFVSYLFEARSIQAPVENHVISVFAHRYMYGL